MHVGPSAAPVAPIAAASAQKTRLAPAAGSAQSGSASQPPASARRGGASPRVATSPRRPPAGPAPRAASPRAGSPRLGATDETASHPPSSARGSAKGEKQPPSARGTASSPRVSPRKAKSPREEEEVPTREPLQHGELEEGQPSGKQRGEAEEEEEVPWAWWRTGPQTSARPSARSGAGVGWGDIPAGVSSASGGNSGGVTGSGSAAVGGSFHSSSVRERGSGADSGADSGAEAPTTASSSPPETARSVGWVTIKKSGVSLVTPRTELGTAQREQQMRSWNRRSASDKVLLSIGGNYKHSSGSAKEDLIWQKRIRALGEGSGGTTSHAKSMFRAELASDLIDGVGFAFGGVEPGRLHAHGKPVDCHRVLYSIAKCGQYKLHVGLRQQIIGGKVVKSVALPGSPFDLTVLPGGAHALASAVPQASLPLSGLVGLLEDGTPSGLTGCRLLLPVADRMGNACVSGGAPVQTVSPDEQVVSTVKDLEDGTYMLEWHSRCSGDFLVSVSIGGVAIGGSPLKIKLLSDEPDVQFTTNKGPGLSTAVVGMPTGFRLSFRDRFENSARIDEDRFFIGLALLPVDGNKDKGEKSSNKEAREKTSPDRDKRDDKRDKGAAPVKQREAWRTAQAHAKVHRSYVDEHIDIEYIAEVAVSGAGF